MVPVARAVAPLGDDVLDLDVALTAGDGERVVVPLAPGELGEGHPVDVEHDPALGGDTGAAVADEEAGLLSLVDDVALGTERPARAGEQTLLHRLADRRHAGVPLPPGSVVPEVRALGDAAEQDLFVLGALRRCHRGRPAGRCALRSRSGPRE